MMKFRGKLALALAISTLSTAVLAQDAVKQYESRDQRPGIKLRSNKVANWYTLGEKVVFRADKALPEEGGVTAIVGTADGGIHLEKKMSAKDFNRDGWSWTPSEPGYYEIRFQRDGASTEMLGDTWDWTCWRLKQDGLGYENVGSDSFTRTQHAIMVCAEATRKPSEISKAFGLSDVLRPLNVEFAAKIGFHGFRVSPVSWDEIEPKKGEFHWEGLDKAMETARSFGFPDENHVFNVFSIPRWASSKCDSNKKVICMMEYMTVMPRDLNDWRNFLRELVKRYPKVRKYELWNEPHFPGFSCFWNDSPENMAALIKAGYETVKKEKPDAVVWFAGLSKRYYPFYRKFLELGGGNYFDVLSVHGSWQNFADFSKIEREYGLPVKPKVASEWHAMLIKPFQPVYPSEQQCARTAMLGFFNMIRQGITEISFFCLFDTGGCELEELAACRKFGRHDPHVSGLFRVKPYIQPRFVGAAWHELVSLIRGVPRVGDGYLWGSEEKGAAALLVQSDAAPLLFIWGLGKNPAEVPAELAKALSKAELLTADGHPIKSISTLKLQPETYYIAKNPDLKEVANWKNIANVLKKDEPDYVLDSNVYGSYKPGALFDANMEPLGDAKPRFMKFRKDYPCFDGAATGAISAEYAAALDGKGLDLWTLVKDKTHHPIEKARGFWDGDSVQISLDTVGKGRPADALELGITMGSDGEARVWKTLSPSVEGDLPAKYTPAGSPNLIYCKAKTIRRGDVTEYRLHVDSAELYPFFYQPGCRMRMALLVNNNDGKARESMLEWGSGIRTEKAPSKHGILAPQAPEGAVATQQDLAKRRDDDYKVSSPAEGTLRVESGAPAFAGVTTQERPCASGGDYIVSFEARGDDALIVMANGKGFKRIDPFFKAISLDDQWKPYRAVLSLPAEAKTLSLSLFSWHSRGKWFEIRDFKVAPRGVE